MENQTPTGYPSIDKPWLKYYSDKSLSAGLPSGSMYDHMVSCNAKRMDNVALNYFGRKILYSELISEIARLASGLSKIGIRCGTVVTAFFLNAPECISLIYALNRLGAVVDLQYANLTSTEIRENLQRMQTKYILAADAFLSTIDEALKQSDFGSSMQLIVVPISRSLPPLKRLLFPKTKYRSERENVLYFSDICNGDLYPQNLPDGKADMPALIVHTSGTTGVPKGVLLSNKNVNTVAVEYQNSLLNLRAGETVLNIAPPFVAFGICLAIHTPLCLGLQVCLSPSPNPETNGKVFSFYKPIHFLGGPAHIQSIVEVQKKKKQELSFARTIGYGGEAISNEDAERYVSFFRGRGSRITHLAPGYGMTEFGGTVILAGSEVWKEGSVGIPLSLANVKIIDPDSSEELPYNKVGEIYMTSPSLMLGYYQNPNEDKQAIVTDATGTRWLKTGDLGEIDRDGFLFLRGRIKRIYLTKGRDNSVYKLFPDYIENIIRECPLVLECAVIVRNEDNVFYTPVAFVILRAGNPAQILNYCKEHLPEYMLPKEVHVIDSVPRTTTGKTDYRALETLATKGG